MRDTGTNNSAELKPIPISARQLEALIRLSEASARTRLDETVRKSDAERAIRLISYCLMQVGFDKETGKIDIDRIATGIPTKERQLAHLVLETIVEMSKQCKDGVISIEEIIKKFPEKSAREIEDQIERIKRAGDIFEARRGFIKLL